MTREQAKKAKKQRRRRFRGCGYGCIACFPESMIEKFKSKLRSFPGLNEVWE